ncbi:uncharacterized protein YALI1_A00905g [Yarrowia lipolytica]|uniref:Uncharacterized protein n=1 Tax=Yarrowia lipolytica TaxID=4952 RepID=A0A1D8N392_YARLL|nr:hypothetical protein YALI1_A00905g [Yarrowia lipolytica]
MAMNYLQSRTRSDPSTVCTVCTYPTCLYQQSLSLQLERTVAELATVLSTEINYLVQPIPERSLLLTLLGSSSLSLVYYQREQQPCFVQVQGENQGSG